MSNDCTVGKLSKRNEAGDEEAICRCNRSCVSGVGVVCPEPELCVRSQSRKWTVPLHHHLRRHNNPNDASADDASEGRIIVIYYSFTVKIHKSKTGRG